MIHKLGDIHEVKNSIKKTVRPCLKWLHFAAVYFLLRLLSDHDLEVLIIIFFAYETGYELTAVDRLRDYSNNFRRWIFKKFSPKRKSHV
jgi:hypothetical protein